MADSCIQKIRRGKALNTVLLRGWNKVTTQTLHRSLFHFSPESFHCLSEANRYQVVPTLLFPSLGIKSAHRRKIGQVTLKFSPSSFIRALCQWPQYTFRSLQIIFFPWETACLQVHHWLKNEQMKKRHLRLDLGTLWHWKGPPFCFKLSSGCLELTQEDHRSCPGCEWCTFKVTSALLLFCFLQIHMRRPIPWVHQGFHHFLCWMILSQKWGTGLRTR